MLDTFYEQLAKELSSKKENLIKDRLIELGINPDEYEKDIIYGRRRFNPILLEVHEGFGELLYYNNNSLNGLFIIGFSEMQFPEFDSETTSHRLSASFNVIDEEPERFKVKPFNPSLPPQ